MSLTLTDYKHAYNLYVTNNMRLSPKFKHLFSAVFNIDATVRSVISSLDNISKEEINLLCRASDLPKYNLSTETVNQYNRKKVIHTAVQYQPITLQFHDDNAGLTTLLLETYFRYFYADSNYTTTPGSVTAPYQKESSGLNNAYSSGRSVSYRYGLDMPGKKQNFFKSIQLLQFHPQNGKSTYTSYTLVNPKIDSLQHDNVTQDGTEFSINTLVISYEAVFYNRGDLVVVSNNSGGKYYDSFQSGVTPTPLNDSAATRGSFPPRANTARDWLKRFN